ncbi:MAG: hypothetical protein R2764_17635 [Bacteroidales bacterium]
METKALNLKFHDRRKFNSSTKRSMYIVGSFIIIIGLYQILISDNKFRVSDLILIIIGILQLIHTFYGKELIKQKNTISISGEEIEYKNSFKKPKIIKINDLADLRIETAKVEFVHRNHRVESYNFSVFQRHEIDDIYKELEGIKANLNK